MDASLVSWIIHGTNEHRKLPDEVMTRTLKDLMPSVTRIAYSIVM